MFGRFFLGELWDSFSKMVASGAKTQCQTFSTASRPPSPTATNLGEGGMATVYLAEDLKHKRKVALKVLKPELAAVRGLR